MLQYGQDLLEKWSASRSYLLKYLFLYIFFPVAFPLIIYKCVRAFRERFGFKQRALEGKVVLLTGASSGIGESLARLLYTSGCRIILASRRVNELERVKSELLRLKTFGTVHVPAIVELDLADLDSIPISAQRAIQVYGHIDILINNAGMSYRGTVLDTKIKVDQRIMTVNYFGPLELTRRILHSMVRRKTGHIVFVSSVQGKIGIPYRSAYAASKHAVQALADSLRAEGSTSGLEVTVVSPGYVQTQLSMNALSGSGEQYGRMDAATAAGHSPDFVSGRIVKAIINCEKEVTIANAMPRAAMFLRHFWPEAFFRLMASRAVKEAPATTAS